MALFGFPFFLSGVFLALAATGILPVDNAPDQKWMPLLLGLMSIAFLFVGGHLVLGRRWLTLDVGIGSLTRRTGLLIPMRSEERRLSDFTAVVIAFESGDSDSSDRHPIRLRAVSGKDFLVVSPVRFKDCREQAEYLSRFLRLPLADTTSDSETVVSAERAGESLQERLLSSEAPEPVLRPPVTRSEIYESDGETKIVIPVRRSRLARGIVALIPAVILLIVIPRLLRFFSQTGTPVGVQLAFLIFLVLIFGLPLIVAIGSAVFGRREATVVKASLAGLTIERRSPWRTRATLIAAPDILDLDCSTTEGAIESVKTVSGMPVAPGGTTERMFANLKKWVPAKGIIVKSREEMVAFGEGLPAAELRYLRSVLRKKLAGR